MNKTKKIKRTFILLLFIIFLIGIVLFIWYQKDHTPNELKIREEQETKEAFEELLLEAERDKNNYSKIVVIDPSHGGSDTGVVTEYGTEKEITLSVACLVQSLNQNENIGIFLTRTTDTAPDASMKEKLIEELKPSLYIDLHTNKDAQATVFGTQTFYLTDYYDDRLTNALLADILEKNTVTAIEGKANGITVDTKGEYAELKGMTIPSASLNMGYLSNPLEGTLLSRESYQQNMAKGLLNAVYEAIAVIEDHE